MRKDLASVRYQMWEGPYLCDVRIFSCVAEKVPSLPEETGICLLQSSEQMALKYCSCNLVFLVHKALDPSLSTSTHWLRYQLLPFSLIISGACGFYIHDLYGLAAPIRSTASIKHDWFLNFVYYSRPSLLGKNNLQGVSQCKIILTFMEIIY